MKKIFEEPNVRYLLLSNEVGLYNSPSQVVGESDDGEIWTSEHFL